MINWDRTEDFRTYAEYCKLDFLHQEDIEWYQDICRIYLDEYPDQEYLRDACFWLNFEDKLDTIIEDYLYYESDKRFENRWLRRK